ncbi:MFS transporter [Thioclava sp. FR2]|uniref:MFS transporter n=1 Tax=Thioclava sp. FR2 TaxID=3445780 RepID=UPI003EBAB843
MSEQSAEGEAGRPGHGRLPSAIWALGLVSLFMDVSSEMIHALLPLYMTASLGASALIVGVIEGIAEATAAVTKVFSGMLSDWIGRRKGLAVLGYGLAAVTKPIFPLGGTLFWVVAARFLDRVGKGIRGAPRDALIADLTPAGMRGAAFGLRQSLDTVGAVLGPLLAIVLMWLLAGDIRQVFWAAVLPAFLSVLVLVVFVREPERKTASVRERPLLSRQAMARLGGRFWMVVLVAAIFTLARFSEAFLLLAATARGVDFGFVPLVLVGLNLAYAASAWPVGRLADRRGRVGLLAVGMGILIAADMVLALSSGLVGLTIGVMLWGLHMGFTQGVLAAIVADAVPEDLRGTGFGVYNLVAGGALLLASVIAGALWSGIGPQATFLAGAGLAATAALCLIPLARLLPKQKAKPQGTR